MSNQLSYADLTQQIEALNLEFKRLKAAEGVFHRQNKSLKALHDTSLGLIEKLDKEELLENILERAASISDTAHGYIYLLEPERKRMQMMMGMEFQTVKKLVRMEEPMKLGIPAITMRMGMVSTILKMNVP